MSKASKKEKKKSDWGQRYMTALEIKNPWELHKLLEVSITSAVNLSRGAQRIELATLKKIKDLWLSRGLAASKLLELMTEDC